MSFAGLPRYSDAFVGREEVLRLLDDLATPGRVVTLVGPGGVGKTRLASEFVRRKVRSDASPPVWFCDLAEADDDDAVCAGVARALDLVVEGGAHIASTGEQIGRRLARDPSTPWLVLDNLERVRSSFGRTLGSWRAAAPQVHFIVTSRRPLEIEGEEIMVIEPLPLPTAEERNASVEECCAAVGLFFARASGRLHGDLTVSDDGLAVAALVRRLEGLPLAIELAAARLDVLPLAEIGQRLSERFRLLRNPLAPAGARHSTLWTTIEWSWECLSDWQRAALGQASVFEGSFDVDAAEGVIELAKGANAPEPVDALHALVRQSLLRADGRFALYASVREFAATRLDEPSLAKARHRHTQYFLAKGRRAAGAYEARGDLAELRSMEGDYDDTMAALRRALHVAEPNLESAQQAAELVLVLGPVLYVRWSSELHLSLIETVRAALAQSAPREEVTRLGVELAVTRASVLLRLGRLDEAMAEVDRALPDARSLALRAPEARLLELSSAVFELKCEYDASRRAADAAIALLPAGEAERLRGLLLLRRSLTDWDAGALDACVDGAEHALGLFREFGNRLDEAKALMVIAGAAYERGDMDAARPLFEAARAAFAAFGERRYEAVLCGYLGGIDHAEEKWDDARAAYGRARATFEEVGDRRLEAVYRAYIGIVAMQQGKLDEAEPLLREAARVVVEVGDRRNEIVISAALAGCVALRGDVDAAEGALVEVVRRFGQSDAARVIGVVDVYLAVVEALRGDLAAARRGAEQSARVPSEDVRLALPLLRRIIANAEELGRTWTFASGGATFRPPGGEAVHLARRAPLARIVDALIRHRLEHPGQLVAKEPLMRAAWPDEARLPMGPGANRLKVAVSALRRLGLEPVILSRRGGYMLDPDVPIRVAELTESCAH